VTLPAVEPVKGESTGEMVFQGRRGPYSYIVNREYEGGPWAWVITEGKDGLVSAGDADDHRKALADLGAELDLLLPPPPARKVGGLVGLFGRLLWGDDGT
jgi:hypothetical protein